MSTEEIEFYIEYGFDVELVKLNRNVADDILFQMSRVVEKLPKNNKKEQYIGGVSLKDNNPTYFMVEYWNAFSDPVYLMKLYIIDVDDYLDLINLNRTIKNELQRTKKRRRAKIKGDNQNQAKS